MKPEIREMNDYFDSVSSVYETIDYYAGLYYYYGDLWVFPVKIVVPFINNMLQDLINDTLQAGEMVLDVGSGTGMYTRSIAKKSKHVYGVDISWGMLRMAQEHLKYHDLNNITFARASVENLPFKDDFFDGVSCCGVLQLFPDVVNALGEMNRVLIDGSKLAVMTYLKREKKKIKSLNIKSIDESLERETHVHFFELDELKGYLEKTGYSNFKYRIYGSMIIFEAEKI